MAIGRITGPMLFSNLERQGQNLAIDGNLVYADVTARRVGINNPSPQYSLDVCGNAQLANIVIFGNTISSTTGKINFGAISNLFVTGGNPYDIAYTDGSGNLSFANLSSLTGLDGFFGNNISLGTNTAGSLNTALTFSTATTVTDAVASLNLFAGNLQTNVNTNTSNISTLFGNAAVQATWLGNLDANLGTATSDISTLFSNATAQAGQINSVNANVTAANAAIATLQNEVYSNANVASYLTVYTGNITAGNISSTFYGNIYTDYIFGNTGNIVTLSGTGAIRVPVGGTSTRPTGQLGYTRFNTDTASVEYYNGSVWVPVTNTVTDQTLTGNGSNNIFTLDQIATNNSILVSINGTVQQPGVAYTVVDTQITFAEIPASTDVIDVRFLGGVVSLNTTLTDDLSVSGNITLSGILSAPLSTKTSTSPGTAGQIAWDTNYIYVCTATNTWKRSALTGGVF